MSSLQDKVCGQVIRLKHSGRKKPPYFIFICVRKSKPIKDRKDETILCSMQKTGLFEYFSRKVNISRVAPRVSEVCGQAKRLKHCGG